ncbi:MAG: M28 family peptidase [Thermodesulfobacteriota bacterium]
MTGWLLLLGLALAAGAGLHALRWLTAMPGASHRGPGPEFSAQERDLALRLEAHVRALCGLGPRTYARPGSLESAADWLAAGLEELGLAVERDAFTLLDREYANLVAEVRGHERPEEIVLVGAHYDTVRASPGADDNASGCAALLEMAREMAAAPHPRTLRLVFFVNEEPPFFMTPDQGSLRYAYDCRRRGDDIRAMLCLESLGYYRDEPGSQSYPFPLSLYYPDRGDFVAFVGNVASRDLARRMTALFRAACPFPSEGAALPGVFPGVSWSDHRSFWRAGYQAVMATDTVPYRNPHYHRPTDTPETLDYLRLARVTRGLAAVVRELARER